MKYNKQGILSFAFLLLFFVLFAGIAEAGIQIDCYARRIQTTSKYKAVDFIITDPMGRKIGWDSAIGKNHAGFDEGYGTTGIEDDIVAEAMIMKPMDGNYVIEITGIQNGGLAMYDLSIAIHRKDGSTNSVSFAGVIETGNRVKYVMTYSSDPAKPAGKVVKFVDAATLKNDINASYRMQMLGDVAMTSLVRKAEAIEASVTKGNKTTAGNQIDAFVNELNAQSGKHVTEDAVKILLEDVKYLKESL